MSKPVMSKPVVNARFGEAAWRLDQDLNSTHGWSVAGPRLEYTAAERWLPDMLSFAEAVRRAPPETFYGVWLDPAPRRAPRIDLVGFLVTRREGGNHHSAFPLGELPEEAARHLTERWLSKGAELAAILHHIEIVRGVPRLSLTPIAKA